MITAVESPTYDAVSADYKERDRKNVESVPYVDAAATIDKESGQYSVFLFNRDLTNSREVEIRWEGAAPSRVLDAFTLTGNDLKAHNSFDAPQNVAPRAFDKPSTANNRTRIELPSRSYTLIQFST